MRFADLKKECVMKKGRVARRHGEKQDEYALLKIGTKPHGKT